MASSTNDKTVWHICSNRWNSAITEYALSSCAALEGQGCKNVFSALEDTIGSQRAQDYGFECLPFRSFGLEALPRFLKAHRSIKPSTIICYEGPETLLAKFLVGSHARVIRFIGKPLRQGMGQAFRSKLSFSHVDRFVTANKVLESELNAITGKPINTITLGCNDRVFYRTETMGSYLKKRPEIVLLARLDPIKGHRRMMSIMRHMLETWGDESRRPLLHIIGQPANLAEIDVAQFAQQAGLDLGADVIISAKRVTPIAEYLSRAILGVVPSEGSEHICRVAEEFLLCGTPIVVSGVGALQEVLFHGAGESFKGCSDAEAARVVSEWCRTSLSEGELKKRERAEEARGLYSLKAMGEQLVALI